MTLARASTEVTHGIPVIWIADDSPVNQEALGDRLPPRYAAPPTIHSMDKGISPLRERFYSAFVGHALPDGLFVHDQQGRIIEVNQNACDSCGYSRDELLAMTMQELEPDFDRCRAEAAWQKIEATVSKPLFGYYRRKDGSKFPVEIHYCLTVVDGESFHVHHVRDITDRKNLEDALSLQSVRAQHLIELPQAAEGLDEVEFMQHGLELAEQLTNSEIGFIHFVNDDEETIEVVTWSRRTLSQYCKAAFGKHYAVSQAGIWAEALRRRQPVVFNNYATAPDRRGLPPGHAELKRIISVPVIENNKVVMLAGVGNKAEAYTNVDVQSVQLMANEIWRILQHRRTKTELQRLALAVAQSPESVIIANEHTLIEYVNAAFPQLIGRSEDEILGQSLRVLSPEMPSETYDAMWKILTEGKPWKGEFRNRRADGTKLTESALVTPICNSTGRITHYLAVLENITDK